MYIIKKKKNKIEEYNFLSTRSFSIFFSKMYLNKFALSVCVNLSCLFCYSM